MTNHGIAAEDTSNWVTPSAALALTTPILTDSFAGRSILDALKAGWIRSVAARYSWEIRDKDPKKWENAEIPSRFWGHLTTGDLWTTGNARFFLGKVDGHAGAVTVSCFGIRFEPKGVHDLISGAPNPGVPVATHSTPLPLNELAPEEPKGPPVSETHLQAWFKLYGEVFSGPDDTLANALKSARGMFPSKFVSRDRVRKLCEGRKRGRKEGSPL
jgi:hypothetical protein